jgi:glycosyltransferase involved in cell wall biosynthesis
LSRPRRIGILTPGFSASESDWCIPAVLDLVRTLAREDDVRVFPLRYPHTRAPYSVFGARVTPLGAAQRRGLWRVPLYVRALSALSGEARRRPFDLLHALWADEPGALAVLAGRRMGVPVVVSILGGELCDLPEIGYGGQRGSVDRRLSASALRLAERVTVGSRGLRERELVRRPALQWRVLPLGVDTARFAPGPAGPSARRLAGRPRLLHVASLLPVKDQSTLLRAFALLGPRIEAKGAHLSIAGDGPLRDRLGAQAAALGISESVSFLGAVSHDALPDLYRQADVLVLSSRFESQGMVVLEAAASGCPTVGTAVGVVPELEDGARAVAPAEPEALARALGETLGNEEARRRMGSAALRVAREKFSLETAVAGFRALYDELSAPS